MLLNARSRLTDKLLEHVIQRATLRVLSTSSATRGWCDDVRLPDLSSERSISSGSGSTACRRTYLQFT